VSAAPSAQNGTIEIQNGTVEITAHDDPGGDLIVQLNESDNIHYTENEEWDNTQIVISDNHRMLFENSDVGDTATWKRSNVTITNNPPGTETEVEIIEDTRNHTVVGLDTNGSDGVVTVSPDTHNTVAVSSHFVQVETRDIGNNTSIDLEVNENKSDDRPYIQIQDLSPLVGYHVRNPDNEVIAVTSGTTSGTFGFNIEESGTYTFYNTTSISVGNFSIDPILQTKKIRTTDGSTTVTYTAENTGNETEIINVSTQADWAKVNTTSRTVASNTSTDIDIVVNNSKVITQQNRTEVIFESNGESESAYLQVERDEASVGDSDSGVSLPLIGSVSPWVLIPVTIVMALIGPVFWVIVEPEGDDNVFL